MNKIKLRNKEVAPLATTTTTTNLSPRDVARPGCELRTSRTRNLNSELCEK